MNKLSQGRTEVFLVSKRSRVKDETLLLTYHVPASPAVVVVRTGISTADGRLSHPFHPDPNTLAIVSLPEVRYP